jgi:hypothetical protein
MSAAEVAWAVDAQVVGYPKLALIWLAKHTATDERVGVESDALAAFCGCSPEIALAHVAHLERDGWITRTGEGIDILRSVDAVIYRLACNPLTLCTYCNAAEATDRDHVVATVHGGSDDGTNTTPACAECNGSKSAWPVREWVERTGRDWPAIHERLRATGVRI